MQLSGPIILIKNSFRLFFKRENLVFFIEIYVFLVISQAASSFLLGKLNVYTDIQNGTLPPLFPQLTLAVITGLVFMVINTFFSVSGYEAVRRIVSYGLEKDLESCRCIIFVGNYHYIRTYIVDSSGYNFFDLV